MDRSELKALVEAEAQAMVDRLGLGHWTLTIDYDLAEPARGNHQLAGTCQRDIKYDLATIELNPNAFPTPERARETILHELLHCLHSPFDLYREAVVGHVNDDVAQLLDVVWLYAAEQTVLNLERLHRNMAREIDAARGKGPCDGTPEPSQAGPVKGRWWHGWLRKGRVQRATG